MARGYFSFFPNLQYVSRTTDRSSNDEYITVKNLFRRAKIREDIGSVATAYYYYTIEGDMRPDQVAKRVYNDPELDWVVLLSNNITNIEEQWPLDDRSFRKFVLDKYGDDRGLEKIHHYETEAFKDGYERVVIPAGLVVDSDFNSSCYDQKMFQETKHSANIPLESTDVTIDDVGTAKNASGTTILGNKIRAVTNYEYEFDMNTQKRNLVMLKDTYLGAFIDDMKKIMSYTKSSQYISKTLKKTYNPRITGV